MRGGFLGNLILVLISILLLATILGLFFNFNLLGYIMESVTLVLAAIIDVFSNLIDTII